MNDEMAEKLYHGQRRTMAWVTYAIGGLFLVNIIIASSVAAVPMWIETVVFVIGYVLLLASAARVRDGVARSVFSRLGVDLSPDPEFVGGDES